MYVSCLLFSHGFLIRLWRGCAKAQPHGPDGRDGRLGGSHKKSANVASKIWTSCLIFDVGNNVGFYLCSFREYVNRNCQWFIQVGEIEIVCHIM